MEEDEMVKTFFVLYVIIDDSVIEEENTETSYELLLESIEELKNMISENLPK